MSNFFNPGVNVNIIPSSETYHLNKFGETIPQASTVSYYDIFNIPNWGMENFIEERKRFRLQGSNPELVSPTTDPGLFFFKVFFDFNTGYGLLGDLVKDNNNKGFKDINTAYQYLINNSNSARFSKSYSNKLKEKSINLVKFGKLLNYFTFNCPWVFKTVEGLNEATNYNFENICPNDKRKITLKFNQEAVDMRIGTLLELYRNACYDYVNFKEVIPENLRKFDMCIILFNSPINKINTALEYDKSTDTSTMTYFNITPELSENTLSYKCLYLKNCEIQLSELNTFPDSITNETGSENEDLSLSIEFDRFYIHQLNKELASQITEYGLFIKDNYETDKQTNTKLPTPPVLPPVSNNNILNDTKNLMGKLSGNN